MTEPAPISRRRIPDRRLTIGAVLLFLFCGLTLQIAIVMSGYYAREQVVPPVAPDWSAWESGPSRRSGTGELR